MKHFSIQLQDQATGAALTTAGGTCLVITAGAQSKVAIATTRTGATATSNNPKALTNGEIEFWTGDSVVSVDLYVMAPGGQFFSAMGIVASGPTSLAVDLSQKKQVATIPFDIADTAAATETDTGFDLPQNAAVNPTGVGCHVSTVDATETIDVGLLSTEAGGDANGFTALISVAGLGFAPAKPTVTTGVNETFVASTTLGAMLVDFVAGTDLATDVGSHFPQEHVGDGTAQSISYTLTAGSDTATGFLVVPYQLPAA